MTRMLWVVLVLVGCASDPNTYQPKNPIYYSATPGRDRAMSYQQLNSIRVDDRKDCPRIDSMIAMIDEQLALKGFTNDNPEDLNAEDRRYNSTARIIKWSLIIGCNNPHRYDKK